MPIGRRSLLKGAAALPLVALRTRPAYAAEFSYKIGTDLPTSHPANKRLQEAADRILKQSGGRLELQVFPNNQLGSSTDMLSQVRSGALELLVTSGGILSPLVPTASLNAVGFAFRDYAAVWQAMDGPLGLYVRGEIAKRGLIGLDRVWDNGYRNLTSASRPVHTPDDLKGFKVRVPVAPLYTGLFQALGASPTAINLSEVYSALQTGIVDGQENPLSVIQSGKFFEVQHYVSMTSHIWDGAWLLANQQMHAALPDGLGAILFDELNRSALDERADIVQLNASAVADLKAKGMIVIDVDQGAFRDVLKRAGFYAEWHKRFGDQAWGVLESTVGPLV